MIMKIELIVVGIILGSVIYLGYTSLKLNQACEDKGGVLYRGSCIKVEVIK